MSVISEIILPGDLTSVIKTVGYSNIYRYIIVSVVVLIDK